MTLLKGIVAAFRSVIFTLLLLILMLYVFGIIFRSQAVGLDIEKKYFHSVPWAMWSLLMHGTFLDNIAEVLEEVLKSSSVLAMVFFVFILLSSFTVMNMLIGIVCEVISKVKQHEDTEADRFYLRTHLLEILDCYDTNNDQCIGRTEFDLLMKNPEILETLREFGTDAAGLIMMSDVIFEKKTENSKKGKLSFEELIDTVMRLQGEHAAKVTDVVELRKFTKQSVKELHSLVAVKLDALHDKTLKTMACQVPNSGQTTTLDVKLTLADVTKTQRHAAALTIRELLAQFADQHGRLVAEDVNGVEMGPELTLGSVAASSECALDLRLKPSPW